MDKEQRERQKNSEAKWKKIQVFYGQKNSERTIERLQEEKKKRRKEKEEAKEKAKPKRNKKIKSVAKKIIRRAGPVGAALVTAYDLAPSAENIQNIKELERGKFTGLRKVKPLPADERRKKTRKQGGGPVYRKKGSSKKGEKKKPTEPSPKTHPGMNTPAIMISIVSPNRRLDPGAQAKKLISGGRTAAERRTDKLQSAARSKVMKASHGGAVVAARHNRASSGPVSRGAGAAVKGIKFKGVR
jgi:hypothetical protein